MSLEAALRLTAGSNSNGAATNTTGSASSDTSNEDSTIMSELLKEAFTATVVRDYEKAVSVIRSAVATDYAFGVEDLELMDHVYSCILNTSHYDETVIEVCWEWIEALERNPRSKDARVVSSSQLSIYYAYHTISRVQDRMPRRPNHLQVRNDTWKRIKESFEYLWNCAVQLWKPHELDRLDILCSLSYIALQFVDVVTEDSLELLEAAKDHSQHVLSTTIVVENAHQANQRINTLERNIKDIRSMSEKLGRKISKEPATAPIFSTVLTNLLEGIPEKRKKEE